MPDPTRWNEPLPLVDLSDTLKVCFATSEGKPGPLTCSRSRYEKRLRRPNCPVRSRSWTKRDRSRSRALIAVLWRSGLRISEAVALQLRDLDLQAGTIRDRDCAVSVDFLPPPSAGGGVSAGVVADLGPVDGSHSSSPLDVQTGEDQAVDQRCESDGEGGEQRWVVPKRREMPGVAKREDRVLGVPGAKEARVVDEGLQGGGDQHQDEDAGGAAGELPRLVAKRAGDRYDDRREQGARGGPTARSRA